MADLLVQLGVATNGGHVWEGGVLRSPRWTRLDRECGWEFSSLSGAPALDLRPQVCTSGHDHRAPGGLSC